MLLTAALARDLAEVTTYKEELAAALDTQTEVYVSSYCYISVRMWPHIGQGGACGSA